MWIHRGSPLKHYTRLRPCVTLFIYDWGIPESNVRRFLILEKTFFPWRRISPRSVFLPLLDCHLSHSHPMTISLSHKPMCRHATTSYTCPSVHHHHDYYPSYYHHTPKYGEHEHHAHHDSSHTHTCHSLPKSTNCKSSNKGSCKRKHVYHYHTHNYYVYGYDSSPYVHNSADSTHGYNHTHTPSYTTHNVAKTTYSDAPTYNSNVSATYTTPAYSNYYYYGWPYYHY